MKKRITSLHTRPIPAPPPVQEPAREFWVTFCFPRVGSPHLLYDTSREQVVNNLRNAAMNTGDVCVPFKRHDDCTRFYYCGDDDARADTFMFTVFGFRFIFTTRQIYEFFLNSQPIVTDLVRGDFNKFSRFDS